MCREKRKFNMKKVYSVGTLLVCSLLLLGACSCSKEEKDSTSSSSENTTQTSKSSSSEASSSQSAESPTESQASSTPQEQESTSGSSGAVASAPTQSLSSIDSDAILNGDFSSISGTWTDEFGNKVSISSDGQMLYTDRDIYASKETITISIIAERIINGVVYGRAEGLPVVLIPAGMQNPYYDYTDDRDRLQIGGTETANDYPYYRS